MKRIGSHLIILVILFHGCKGTITENEEIPVRTPAWVSESLVQPVPSWGSSTRLILPVQVNQIFTSHIGAFGSHQGGHVEGLDHIWLEVVSGIPIKSWASGTVKKIENMGLEYHITIEYDGGLIGRHMEVQTSLVSVGQRINAGDPVCYGLNYGNMQSAEFQLVDMSRNDGVLYGDRYSYVSPFDYLRSDLQEALIAKYRSEIIDTYFSRGVSTGNCNPAEPYLTNPVLFHKQYKRTLAGEWVLSSTKWASGSPPDILVFQDISNLYYRGRRVIAADDASQGQSFFNGVWDADTTARKFTILSGGVTYYGIYEVIENGSRASLKIEYSTSGYPLNFSANHLVYRERANYPRREDAEKMGVY